jgi:hypothetical protein
MPNLTFYLSQEHAARFSDLRDLTRTCSALCTGILAAESENVHIIYVDVNPDADIRYMPSFFIV